MLLNISPRAHATILAALALWQEETMDADGNMVNAHDALTDIATNGDTVKPLTKAEIDALCEGINGGELVITSLEQLENVEIG